MVQQTSRRSRGFVIFLVALASVMLLGGWLWHAWDHRSPGGDTDQVATPALDALHQAQEQARAAPEPIPTVVIPDGPVQAAPPVVTPTVAAPVPEAPEDEAALARRKSSDLNKMGYRAYKRGDLLRARSMYKLAVQEDPTHALAWYNLACMEGLRGDGDRALEALRRSKAADPSKALASQVQGDEDFEALWRDEAWMGQVRRLDRDPPDASILHQGKAPPAYRVGDPVSNPLRSSAEMAMIQRRVPEARDLYQKATHAKIQDAEAWLGLARSEALLGRVEPCLEALQEYRALRPGRDLIMEVSEDDAFARVWGQPGFQTALRRLAR